MTAEFPSRPDHKRWPPRPVMLNLYASISEEIGQLETQKFGMNQSETATVLIAAFAEGTLDKHIENSTRKSELKFDLERIETTGSQEDLNKTLDELGPEVFMKLGNDVTHISSELNVMKNVFRNKAFDENSANTKALNVGSRILGILDQSYGQA